MSFHEFVNDILIFNVQGWTDKMGPLFPLGLGKDIAEGKGDRDMTLSGFINATKNNILSFNLTTFIRHNCFHSTAELRDCADDFMIHLYLLYQLLA